MFAYMYQAKNNSAMYNKNKNDNKILYSAKKK